MKRIAPGVGVAGLAGPLAALLLVLVCPGSATVTPEAWLATAGAPSGDPSGDPAAVRLLARAAAAPDTTTYRGVQYVSAWTASGATSLVVRVEHEPGVGTQVRSAHTPAGPVDAFLPADPAPASLMGDDGALRLLTGTYRVVLGGTAVVTGRDATVVEVHRAEGAGLAARFWLDRETGLVLRRELYDGTGRTTRASAFVELEATTGDESLDGATMSAASSQLHTTAWPQALDAQDMTAMRSHGWDCPAELPGSLRLVDARRSGDEAGAIVHLSYTDGLASVSVFEQPGRLATDRLRGWTLVEVGGHEVYRQDGIPQRYAWSAGGRVFTVVADAPPRTVRDVVAALPHGAEPGTMARLGRGMDRVASWFNPFE